MNRIRLYLALVSCCVLAAATAWAQSAGDYRSKQSGNWNAASTWQRFDGVSWVDTSTTPTSSDGIITIRSPHTVTITATVTYDQVVVEAGAQVTVSSAVTHTLANGTGTDLTINGTWLNQGGTWTVTGASWVVNDGGTFIHNTTSGIATPLGLSTLDAASTFIYRGSSTLTPATSFAGKTYGNLSLESSSGTWTAGGTGSSALTINGNFSIGTGVTWNATGYTGNISVTGAIQVDGTWNSASNITVQSSLTISSGASTQVGAGDTLQANSSVTVDGTLSGADPSTSVLRLKGTWSNLTLPTSEPAATFSQIKVWANSGSRLWFSGIGNLQSGATFDIDNSSTLSLTGSGAEVTGGTINVKNSGKIDLSGNNLTLDGVALNVTTSGEVADLYSWGGTLITQGATMIEQGASFSAPLHVTSATTTASGTNSFDGNIHVYGGATLSIPSGKFLRATGNVTVDSAATVAGPGTLYYVAPNKTFTNSGTISAPVVFEGIGFQYTTLLGNGTWSSLSMNDSLTVYLGDQATLTNANATLRGTLSTNGYTLLLNGGSFHVESTGEVNGAGLTVETQGTVSITQNGTFDEALHVLGGTTTASGKYGFNREITVDAGATLHVPAGDSLIVMNDLTVSGSITGGNGASVLKLRGMGEGLYTVTLNDAVVSIAHVDLDDGNGRYITGSGTFTGATVKVDGGSGLTLNGDLTVTGGSIQLGWCDIDLSSHVLTLDGVNLTLGASADVMSTNSETPGYLVTEGGTTIEQGGAFSVKLEVDADTTTVHGTFYDVQIDNPGSIALNGVTTINGTLNVLGGNLTTGSYALTLASSATVSETPPYSVVGNLTATRECSTGVNQTFGGMGVEINAAGAWPGSTTVTRVTGAASTLPTGPSILRYFDIAPATNSGLNATTVFHYFDGELNGRNESRFVLFKSTDAGSTWNSQGGTVNTSGNTVSKTGISSFSRWTVGESYPAPTLASVSPTSGTTGSTLNVTLTGTGFVSGVTTVYFDTSITVNSVTVGSSTSLTASITISAGTSAGARNVSVTNPPPGGGSATLTSAFNVTTGNPAPTLTAISPATAALGATLDIVMTGTGFSNGVTTPSFASDITANSFTINSSTQLTANVTVSPTAVVGARSVSVTNSAPGGGTATLVNALSVQYPPPMLASVSPNSASRGQTLSVTLTGDGYYTGITSVSFGANITVNSLTLAATTQLTASITVGPNAATGLRSVIVNNAGPGGGSAVLPNAFTVNNPVPTLVSILPTSGNRSQTMSVVLRGSGFVAGLTTVSFGPDITVNSTVVDSATQITVGITISPVAATGSRDVTVTNPAPGGGTGTLPNAFTVGNPVPTLSSVNPTVGVRGGTMTVTVTGTNFIDGVSSIDFGTGITVNSASVTSTTQMSVGITIALDAALESRSVSVTNPAPGGGTATLSSAFSVNNPAPTLASISPTSGNRGQTLSVTVTGTGFIPGVSTVTYGSGVTVNSVTSFSSSQVTASVTINIGAATGPRDITVTNAAPGGGTATLAGAFTVTNPSPTLTAVLPNRAGRGSKINVVLTGTNFLSDVSSVSFGPDITVNSTTIASATQIQVNISVAAAAATGARNVAVTNTTPGGGTATLASGFTVDTSPATSVENSLSMIPDDYVLQEAFPNPFNPSTKIRYGLPERSRVRLEVYNMLGNVVAELVSGERSKGLYEVEWVADNLPSGVYLVRFFGESVESGKRLIASRKVVLVK